MGNPIKKLLKQKLVYFANRRSDGVGGHTWDSGVEVDCRFDYVLSEEQDEDGETFTAEGQILSISELQRGAAVYLGPISELSAAQVADARLLFGTEDETSKKLKFIGRTSATPNLKATWWVRMSWFKSK